MVTVLLAVLGVMTAATGHRIPIKPFSTVTGLIIFYPGFEFIGSGIHGAWTCSQISGTRQVQRLSDGAEKGVGGFRSYLLQL